MSGVQAREMGGIGRWMMILAWVLLLVLLSFLFSGILDKQNNPNQNPVTQRDDRGALQVVLKRNRSGHYVASGRINGHPVQFLLDTGATDVAVSDELAEKLDLPRGQALYSQTANGMVRSWQTRLSEVGLGAITLSDVRASVLPTMAGDEVLLGMSFLKQLEWTQKGDQLTLRKL